MKVTSEQLLELFGLKVGDEILLQNSKYDIRDTTHGIVLTNYEFDSNIPLSVLCNEEFEIIKPKPTLTDDEKVILRNIDEKFEWIARAKNLNFGLMLFRTKPIKDGDVWNDFDYSSYPSIFDHLFQFISWEDEEPYNIKELLDEEK